jgi:hypothetical protein
MTRINGRANGDDLDESIISTTPSLNGSTQLQLASKLAQSLIDGLLDKGNKSNHTHRVVR